MLAGKQKTEKLIVFLQAEATMETQFLLSEQVYARAKVVFSLSIFQLVSFLTCTLIFLANKNSLINTRSAHFASIFFQGATN